MKETQARHALAEARLKKPAARRRMTEEEVTGLVTEMGSIMQALEDADPADKAEIYQRLGLTLTYHRQEKRVAAEARPNSIMYVRECPRTDCTKKPICHAAPGQRVRGWRCGGCAVTAADRTIRWSTAVALIEVAAVAAVVSYEHAYALVCAHGETGWTARWLLGLGSRRRSLRTWPTAWATAWSERSWRCGLLWVALVGSYELLMIIIRSAQVSAEMDSEVVVRVPDPPPSQPGWSGSV